MWGVFLWTFEGKEDLDFEMEIELRIEVDSSSDPSLPHQKHSINR